MDIFHSLDHIKNKRSFMEDCISQSYKVKCNELDCSKNFCRVFTKKTASEILDISEQCIYSFWNFIIRDKRFPEEKEYIEAGMSATKNLSSPEYFIWIYIDLEKLDYFVKKYDLKR